MADLKEILRDAINKGVSTDTIADMLAGIEADILAEAKKAELEKAKAKAEAEIAAEYDEAIADVVDAIEYAASLKYRGEEYDNIVDVVDEDFIKVMLGLLGQFKVKVVAKDGVDKLTAKIDASNLFDAISPFTGFFKHFGI